ncbi:MAG: hypothetical protein H7222_15820 [Methylotenera sp.]|nr:hypothetical protein [Oligoflexia bacterium]
MSNPSAAFTRIYNDPTFRNGIILIPLGSDFTGAPSSAYNAEINSRAIPSLKNYFAAWGMRGLIHDIWNANTLGLTNLELSDRGIQKFLALNRNVAVIRISNQTTSVDSTLGAVSFGHSGGRSVDHLETKCGTYPEAFGNAMFYDIWAFVFSGSLGGVYAVLHEYIHWVSRMAEAETYFFPTSQTQFTPVQVMKGKCISMVRAGLHPFSGHTTKGLMATGGIQNIPWSSGAGTSSGHGCSVTPATTPDANTEVEPPNCLDDVYSVTNLLTANLQRTCQSCEGNGKYTISQAVNLNRELKPVVMGYLTRNQSCRDREQYNIEGW